MLNQPADRCAGCTAARQHHDQACLVHATTEQRRARLTAWVNGGTTLRLDYTSVDGDLLEQIRGVAPCDDAGRAQFHAISCQGTRFSDGAGFRDVTFLNDALFDRATFTAEAAFEGVSLAGAAKFGGASFADDTRFDRASFAGAAHFREASFAGYTSFHGASFADAWFEKASFATAHFRDSSFAGVAMFPRASFDCEARFGGVSFTGYASFAEASFARLAWFDGASFASVAQFEGASFTDDAWFQWATFASVAWFRRASFTSVARFELASFAHRVALGPLTAHRVVIKDAVFGDGGVVVATATAVDATRLRLNGPSQLRVGPPDQVRQRQRRDRLD